jgi:glutamine synthetase
METYGGMTLCIPSVFVSYSGYALDYKAPLLKSVDALNKAATAVCQYFDKDVTKVTITLGIEQEYFAIDRSLFLARPDLMSAGRCVIGHSPAKGQQLSDHYFGSIPDRIKNFMRDFEIEAHKLGIPLRTRHNEVAPSQFECAPEFEEVNLAIDHNLLLMDLMNRVAHRHNLEVLFHEKPFAGINGSGKHNNWSMSTNTGKNLLAPSSKAKENLQFLVFFVNVIKAVHKHADLLRASIASASNDYRLGAHEAPPAIISVFCGQQLSRVLDEIEQNGDVPISKGDNMYMKLGIDKIPPILLDNTDRNRTSPFAFTGNKFEFRAVGSSANCAGAMTVLNTIVADQLNDFRAEVDVLVEAGEKKELAIVNVMRRYISESKAIRFEGNNYSEEWQEEAKRRGLSNLKNTPAALAAYTSEKSVEVFGKLNIFSKEELVARQEILYELYSLNVQIESRLLGDLAQNHVFPIAVRYQNELLKNVKLLKEMGMLDENDVRLETIKKISTHINVLTRHFKEMVKARKEANNAENAKEMALAYSEKVKPHFEIIRRAADKLELLLDDENWNLPKYRELLFIR